MVGDRSIVSKRRSEGCWKCKQGGESSVGTGNCVTLTCSRPGTRRHRSTNPRDELGEDPRGTAGGRRQTPLCRKTQGKIGKHTENTAAASPRFKGSLLCQISMIFPKQSTSAPPLLSHWVPNLHRTHRECQRWFLVGGVCSLISRLAKERETDGADSSSDSRWENEPSRYTGASTGWKEKTVLQQHLVL